MTARRTRHLALGLAVACLGITTPTANATAAAAAASAPGADTARVISDAAALRAGGWGVGLESGTMDQDPSGPHTPEAGGARGAALSAGVPATWTLQGAGAGHGVGMSQYGALAQAQAGWSAAQILKFYYSGTTVSPAADAMTLVVNLQSDVSSSVVTTSALASGGGAFSLSAGGKTIKGVAGNTVTLSRTSAGVTVSCPSCTGGASLSSSQVTMRFADGKTLANVGGGRYDVGILTIVPSRDNTGTLEVGLRVRLHDEYLDRIAEMPWGWPSAALQAQAAAARAYALSKVKDGLRPDCSCHVYDSTYDQVFYGYPATGNLPYWTAWKNAVRAGGTATAGVVPRYAGAVVRAYYSASNGGYTQASADAWGTALPYLVAKADPWSSKPGNPYLFWSKTVSAADLQAATGSREVARLNLATRAPSHALGTVKAYDRAGAATLTPGALFAGRLGLNSPWVRHRGERLSAPDQASLAVSIARSVPATASTVVLTSADPNKLADAVAVPPLAKALGAPVLLTDQYAIPLPTVGELNRRVSALKTAYVIGGEATISERVVDQLKARGMTVVRIAGADRFEVSANIATRLHQLKPVRNVIVVGGNALPDAITVGGPAAGTGSAILFTAPASLSAPAAGFLQAAKPKTAQVVGGSASVSGAVVSQLQARKITTVRLSGADRYGVSVAVSAYFVPRIPGTRLVVASGDNAMLQDGVLGAAFARPTLLIDTDRLPGNSAAYLQSLGWIGTVTGIGGPAHINDATWTAVLES
ncbi:SpoIID/LytB domain-containing protein [Nostocoides veronense]|uniref:Sporulation stage II protein D amidase enhancer LytB N-terminal domain-containing protein n=1 Tax=Nostocoides veronense TaxID=330836 RepID=A0ABN2LI39_9MICO